MNEWAARLMSVFPDRNKVDLEEFIQQVTHDQAEHMYFHKEYNAEIECRPSFEQLSHERVVNEANKDVNLLKALESIVHDRMSGYTSLNSALLKSTSSYELLETVDGTLKVALDSLFVFTDQEIQQSRQHVFLGDLKKSLNEMRSDATRRITDYQKEIATAEKEVTLAEKRLAKTKEALERCVDHRAKMESFELDVIVNSARPVYGFGSSGGVASNASNRTASKEAGYRDNGGGTPVSGGGNNPGGGGGNSTGSGGPMEDSVTRIERELREDVRLLIRTIEQRDNVLAASRRAFQKLHRECRRAAQITIQKIAEKEAEQSEQRRLVLEKLCGSVRAVDIDHDEREFIEGHSSVEGGLTLNSQALSLLNDLATPPPALSEAMEVSSYGSTKSGMYTYADANRIDARTNSRSGSPLVKRQGSGYNIQTPTHQQQQQQHQAAGKSPPMSPTTPAKTGPLRFSSFRRKLGLSSSESAPKGESAANSAASSISTSVTPSPAQNGGVPLSVPAATLPVSAPAHSAMPTVAVVAAGRVGGDPQQVTSPGSVASAPASLAVPTSPTMVAPGICKADFTAHLTQIFYTPAASPAGGRGLTGSRSEPAIGSAARTGVSERRLLAPLPDTPLSDANTAPTTPKVLIDDNYFHPPAESAAEATSLTSVDGAGTVDASGSSVRQEPLSFAKHPVDDAPPVAVLLGDSPSTRGRKSVHREARINKLNFHRGALEWLQGNPHSSLIDAVEWICRAIKTQAGRDAFTTELNQFRSRKVEVGEGFEALGAVLWTALSNCQAENDVHNASVIMMLSQTFYRRINRTPSDSSPTRTSRASTDPAAPAHKGSNLQAGTGDSLTKPGGNESQQPQPDSEGAHREQDHDSDEDDGGARGAENRQYIKDLLTAHPIWRDGNYWEQTLWQCAIEQLQTIPYDRAWHDMPRDMRREAVRRVHEVIFSQVMAVTHSMMEMGCSPEQSREFLYRMCVIHQLSEAMRHSLLKHVSATAEANSARRSSRASLRLAATGSGDSDHAAEAGTIGDALGPAVSGDPATNEGDGGYPGSPIKMMRSQSVPLPNEAPPGPGDPVSPLSPEVSVVSV